MFVKREQSGIIFQSLMRNQYAASMKMLAKRQTICYSETSLMQIEPVKENVMQTQIIPDVCDTDAEIVLCNCEKICIAANHGADGIAVKSGSAQSAKK